jgi:hypothetical protein
MPVNLTIIIGAGAAFDVVNPQSNQVKTETSGSIFRPPITADLLHTHRDWENEYMNFPAVASVIEELRSRIPSNRTSVNVENLLKELKESSKQHRNDTFREFPLYLQRFFTAVSERYCRKPSNYMTLIGKIFDLDLSKVAFVTTNYDLLFDQALLHHPATKKFSISDPNMDKYITDERWVYIKLHGSIDWGRHIKEDMIKNKSNTLPGLIDNVAQLGTSLESALESEIIRDSTFNQDNRELIYPAISVPIGESKLNCRDEHINTLKEHLNNCQHFLVIGFSGYDKDVLKLLDEKSGGFGQVLFVSGSEESANNAREKFKIYGELGQKMHAGIYPGNGFDEFVRSSNGLSEYLNRLH